jgi:uncharacterized repeat protein (TIGR02543 family)
MERFKHLACAVICLFAIVACDFIVGTGSIGYAGDSGETTTYTVHFNANGGMVNPSSITRNAGATITLPTPTKNGYTFNGWFSAIYGGIPYGIGESSYTVSENITMFAQWTQDSNGLGEELRLSGQVFSADLVGWGTDSEIVFRLFDGNRTITAQPSGIGGFGAITRGQFNFNINSPTATTLENINTFFDGMDRDYDNFRISNTNANIVLLWFEVPSGSFRRESRSITRTGNTTTYTDQEQLFIYVDKDVTISGRGRTAHWTGEYYSGTTTTKNLDITLKRGWNTMLIETIETETESSNNIVVSETITISLGNPDNLGWTLWEWGNFSTETEERERRGVRSSARISMKR